LATPAPPTPIVIENPLLISEKSSKSIPAPPLSVSLPPPPRKMSLPLLPVIVSLNALPITPSMFL
jgi:hypothetical protein